MYTTQLNVDGYFNALFTDLPSDTFPGRNTGKQFAISIPYSMRISFLSFLLKDRDFSDLFGYTYFP